MLPACLVQAKPEKGASHGIQAEIRVDQVGYLPGGPKLAMVQVPASVSATATQAASLRRFRVLRVQDGRAVLEGRLGPARLDPSSGDTLRAADFSKLRASGEYCLEVPGMGRSWPFRIDAGVFTRTYYLGARAFYGQRCGVAVDLGPQFPGCQHPPCHLHGRFHASSGRTGARDNVGGWHDAGDYGRYVVNSAISVAHLLRAWEFYGPRIARVRLDLPETGKGTPDLLAEARWNLEWMLKMQDEDGGVFHKQTSEAFPGFVAPEADGSSSCVIGTGTDPFKSTCATADLAACAAMAARIYQPHDAAFAARCLQAAERAWAWAMKHPAVTFRNPAGISTGEYGDAECGDELFWASAELWAATRKAEYQRYFLHYLPTYRDAAAAGPSWSDVAALGLWAYALVDDKSDDKSDDKAGDKARDAEAVREIRARTLAAAAHIAARIAEHPYRVALTHKDYIWGSNSVAATYGIVLLMADRFSPQARFREGAADALHYLLGRNPLSLSYVTGIGARAPIHIHHRPSGVLGRPWPGLLVGGPNAGRQDTALAKLPVDIAPARAYVDDQESFAANEVAINWQAAFVFLAASQLP